MGGVGVGAGRMVDGCLSPLGYGMMVTWEGDHMAAPMSYPCPVLGGGSLFASSNKSCLSKFSGGGGVCMLLC